MTDTPPLPDGRSLDVLRAHIDAVDHELLQLLSRRNGLVAEVARYKREHSVGIRDRAREHSLLSDRRERAVPLGLQPNVIESIFRLMLWASRDRQAALKAEVPLDVDPKTIAIIGGKGGMGRLMAKLFADLGHAVMIVDIDTELTAEVAAETADVVMIAVPIEATVDVITDIAPHVRAEALLIDITSIKASPMQAMMDHCAGSVVGAHPLFGPSVHSVQGQRLVLTPGRGEAWLEWCRTMFGARGLIIEETDPEHHDRMMAIVQVLTHFSTEVLGRAMQRLGVTVEETLAYTSPVYLLDVLMTARHFAQSPELYASIQMSNPRTAEVTTTFVEAAEELAGYANAENRESFVQAFTEVADHLGDFTSTALDQSSYLIDRLVERAE
ncbi:MAG: bifunctional chorismate mutase/prephenate dehydrogenase [Planctomycetota bacterium]